MSYDDVWNTSQDGKNETPDGNPVGSPVGTPVGSPDSSNNRKIINSTIDLPERVRGLNNGVVNNGEVNNGEVIIEVGNDNQLGPEEQYAYVSEDEDPFNINYDSDGGRRRRKSRRHRKSKKRRGRKSRRKSKKRRKSRRKY